MIFRLRMIFVTYCDAFFRIRQHNSFQESLEGNVANREINPVRSRDDFSRAGMLIASSDAHRDESIDAPLA